MLGFLYVLSEFPYNFFIIVVFLMVPAFLLGVVCKGGRWGFVLGMFIGSAVGWFVLPLVVPIWLPPSIMVVIAFLALAGKGGS